MRYTDEEKTAAVATYIKEGGAEASRQHGMTSRSVRRWAEAEGKSKDRTKNLVAASAMFELERAALRVKLVAKLDDLLERMDAPHYDYRGSKVTRVEWETATSGDVKNYAISFGVLLDKLRLELGEATGRMEQVDLAVAESRVDQEIIRLSDAHDDIHS